MGTFCHGSGHLMNCIMVDALMRLNSKRTSFEGLGISAMARAHYVADLQP